MEAHLEVAGLLDTQKDGWTCVSVNAFESVLCGKGLGSLILAGLLISLL